MAVTKYASIAQVRELIEVGHADFGESRMQHFLQFAAQVDDFLERHRELGPSGGRVPDSIRWHFIGHLQRNKVKALDVPLTALHSLDSAKLARELVKRDATPARARNFAIRSPSTFLRSAMRELSSGKRGDSTKAGP